MERTNKEQLNLISEYAMNRFGLKLVKSRTQIIDYHEYQSCCVIIFITNDRLWRYERNGNTDYEGMILMEEGFS